MFPNKPEQLNYKVHSAFRCTNRGPFSPPRVFTLSSLSPASHRVRSCAAGGSAPQSPLTPWSIVTVLRKGVFPFKRGCVHKQTHACAHKHVNVNPDVRRKVWVLIEVRRVWMVTTLVLKSMFAPPHSTWTRLTTQTCRWSSWTLSTRMRTQRRSCRNTHTTGSRYTPSTRAGEQTR